MIGFNRGRIRINIPPPALFQHGNEISGFPKGVEFIDQMGHCQLVKKDFAVCITYLYSFAYLSQNTIII